MFAPAQAAVAKVESIAKEKAMDIAKGLLAAALMPTTQAKPPMPPRDAFGQKYTGPISLGHSANTVAQKEKAPDTSASGGGGGGASGGQGGGKGGSGGKVDSEEDCKKRWVDINLNDLKNTLGAIVNLPLALALRGLAEIVPGLGEALMTQEGDPMHTAFGTGDKTGLAGFFFGNNSAKDIEGATNEGPTPGVMGIAMGLAHLENIGGVNLWGDVGLFEKEQADHDRKTGGVGSNAGESGIETIGQGLGVLARHVGLGEEFYNLVADPASDSDFERGVRSGAHTCE